MAVYGVSAALAVGMIVAGGGAAYAAKKTGWKACASSEWSYTSVTSTESTTHYHEIPAEWKSSTKAAGFSSYKGWKNKGAVWMELNSTGSFSTYNIGCSL